MNDCHEIKKHLYVFLDDELSVTENVGVLHHLEHCKLCFSLFEQEKQFGHSVKKNAMDQTLPAGMLQRMTSALEQADSSSSPVIATAHSTSGWGRRIAMPLFSLAAAILLILGTSMILGILETNKQPTRSVSAGELAHALSADFNVHLQGNKPLQACSDLGAVTSWLNDVSASDRYITRVCVPNLCKRGYQVEGASYSPLIDEYNTTMTSFTLNGKNVAFFCFNVGDIDFDEEHMTRIAGRDVLWKKQNGATVVLWGRGKCSHSIVSTVPDDELLATVEMILKMKY